MRYENRIKILSKSLRITLGDHAQVINLILQNLESLKYNPIDGGVFIDTFSYELETGEIIFEGKSGPAPRVAKFLSLIHPDAKIRIAWTSESFKNGTLTYQFGEIVDQ
jgi:hypothetical protein